MSLAVELFKTEVAQERLGREDIEEVESFSCITLAIMKSRNMGGLVGD